MFYKKKPTIAIFCGSQKGNKTIYSSQSKKIARILCKNSYPIIYGGGRTGLMGTISDTIKKSCFNITLWYQYSQSIYNQNNTKIC